MSRVLTLLATPAAVSGGLAAMGDGVMRAGFAGALAGLALVSFRFITSSPTP